MVERETPLSPEQLLQRAPLFANLSRRSLHKLAELCTPRSYQTGAMIIEERGTGLGLFVITAGRLEVFKGSGDSRLVLAELGSGDILGEMALIDDQPRSASAVALEPTECLLITRGSFQTLVRKDPEIAWCIVPALAERIRELQRMIIDGGVDLVQPEQAGPDRPGDPDKPGDAAPQPASPPAAAAPADEAAPEEPPATSTDAAEETPLLLWALREQHALTMAGLTGLQGGLSCAERFFSSLAGETELTKSESLSTVLRELPHGLRSAAEAALEQGERLPERMLSRYRRHRSGRRRS